MLTVGGVVSVSPSGTTSVAGSVSLPSPSTAIAVISSPGFTSSSIGTDHVPSSFAVVVAVSPSGKTTTTVAPGSVVPVTVSSPSLIGSTVTPLTEPSSLPGSLDTSSF